MNKTDLIERISAETKVSKRHTAKVVDQLIITIRDELKNDGEVKLHGRGNFTINKRGSHKARNPKTGETLYAEPKKFVKFKCSTTLRTYINEEQNS